MLNKKTINEERWVSQLSELLSVANTIRGHRLTIASRLRNYVWSRRMFMVWLRRNTHYSLHEIGQVLGGIHHSSVLHHLKAHDDLEYSGDIEYLNQWDDFNRRMTNRYNKIKSTEVSSILVYISDPNLAKKAQGMNDDGVLSPIIEKVVNQYSSGI